MKAIVFFYAVAIVIICAGCEKNPADSKGTPTNPREYKWRVDTLAYPGSFQTSMRDMWGSSSKDIYVAGHNDRAFGKIYHYDGKTWTSVRLHILEGGTIPNIGTLSAIYGFSANEVWVVSERTYYNPNPPRIFSIPVWLFITTATNGRKRKIHEKGGS